MAGFFSRGIDEKAVVNAIHDRFLGKLDVKNVNQLNKALAIVLDGKTVRDHITALYKQHLTSMGRTEELDINDNNRMVFLAQIMCRDSQEYILGKIPDDQLLRNLISYCSSKQPEAFAPADYAYAGEAANLRPKAPLQTDANGRKYIEFNGVKYYPQGTNAYSVFSGSKSMTSAPTQELLRKGQEAPPANTRIARGAEATANAAKGIKNSFLGFFGYRGGAKRKTYKQKKTKKSRKVRKGRKGTARK